jgi:hypothetical protein
LENGVTLHASTRREHVKKILDTGCVGIDPQRSGGHALPSTIEKRIADMVKHLRVQYYPVFPEDVLKWAEEAIEGNVYAKYFPEVKPNREWFSGWLRSMEFLTSNLRPLEQTRSEWYTA